MTEALKCPACAASLEYPPDGGMTMVCPYCGSTVLLSGATQAATQGGGHAGSAATLSRVIERIRARDMIEAIKIYRQMHHCGLAEAKAAVEAIQRQEVPHGANLPTEAPTKYIALAVGAVVLLIAGVVALLAPPPRAKVLTPTYTPPTPMAVPRFATPARPPEPPEFATMTLQFGSEGIGAGNFEDARSIATDNQGHLFVAEYSTGRVQVFDMAGKFLSGWLAGKDKYIQNIAADRNGTLYVAANGDITAYQAMTGKQADGSEARKMSREYCDVCATLDGGLYATDYESNISQILPATGQVKRSINTADELRERPELPHLAVSGTGEIFALSRSKGVFKFGVDGHYINRFGGGGTILNRQAGKLFSPFNIAVDGKGRVYVSDAGSGIQVFDSDGGFLGSFGGNTVIFGMTITDGNEIYACCRNDHAVRKFVLKKN